VPAKKRKCSECERLTGELRACRKWCTEASLDHFEYCAATHDAESTITNITFKVMALRSLWDAEKKEHEKTLRTLDEVRREKNKEIADLKADVNYWKPIVKEYERRAEMPWWRRRKAGI
jgi:hypothetical protein